MSHNNKDVWDQLGHFVSVITKQYLDALLILHEKLDGKNIKWILNGDLAERLKIVKVEPDCIGIISSSEDTKKIFEAVKEFSPNPIIFQTTKLPRDAIVNEKELPVYVRSFYFDFNINGVKVKIDGNLQFKVNEWDWGDVLEFTPEYVYVIGKKIAVTPLSVASQLYRSLGWNDRVEKIREVTEKSHGPRIKPNLD